MSEPTLDEFLRHLQASLDSASDIPDGKEREARFVQLETAIQEAIIFKNRYAQLIKHGVDPLRLQDPLVQELVPQASASETLQSDRSRCSSCGRGLDADLDFCAACGAKN